MTFQISFENVASLVACEAKPSGSEPAIYIDLEVS